MESAFTIMPEASDTHNDTIGAIASAVGGAVAVIRVSGPDAVRAVTQCWRGRLPVGDLPPRELHVGRATGADGSALDRCLAVRFPAPGSYTGEDMVELHCHGGALSARAVLLRVLEQGVRHAEPGEFTRRAFLNGKMDLTQAEAVADLIEAHTDMALRLANRQLDGLLGRRTEQLFEQLMSLLGEIESRLDFPEEDLDWKPAEKLPDELAAAVAEIDSLLANRREGEVLRNGVRLVIAGAPNVGKSSLMNAILGRDRAIVTHIPGTTRDTLEELAHIRGIPVRLIDTAGIREAQDIVEKSGVERSLSSLHEAQVVLWVCEATKPLAGQRCPYVLKHVPVIVVANKTDQLAEAPARRPGKKCEPVYTCALTGEGLEDLCDAVEKAVWERPHTAEPETAVSSRHAALLGSARHALTEAEAACVEESFELAAVGLRQAADDVGRITGRTAAPDVLDDIFSRFCIGK